MEYQPPKADEKCFLLREYDSFLGKKLIRYQTLVVVRDDELREFIQPLGPSENFKGANDVMIYSGLEDSCAELMDAAENLRFDNGLKQVLAEQSGNSTLYKDWLQNEEMKREFVRRYPRTLANLRSNK